MPSAGADNKHPAVFYDYFFLLAANSVPLFFVVRIVDQ